MTIRVLLVDDEPHLRLLLRAQLELNGGFSVVAEAELVSEVLETAASHLPDLVVLDLQLRDGDSGSLVAQLRALSPSATIVVLSAQASEVRAAQVLSDGAHAYYEKGTGTIRAFPTWLAGLHEDVSRAA